ncbi:tol-pal system-associated acyl-CoA thioesterase [Spongiibacter marinus]|uniref:tol-pal system-associated acyl-CoA thioesterase n=1 Tax=Spongiibacter marinus TaxID=354246 RepID=UPI0023BA9CF9|nr:tol-pal system-associated acyl-CoA thioesterase [Spongiibacter marinus]MBM7424181.1 tol-pal system-associated acyl-CoA thioesterase [Spongiibacter marinus]
MSAEFSLPLRVYIEDTDAGGIVYYVNYLKYMERARTEYMRERGFAKAAMADDGLLMVVRDVQARYHASAKLDDVLRVTANIKSLRPTALMFEQHVYRDQELLCEACIQIACVDPLVGRARRLPKTIYQVLAAEAEAAQ